MNGEAIYGTRPWRISGEGPTGTAEGHLSESKNKPYTAKDIRYTQDGKNLYAILLDWPQTNRAVVTSLCTARDVGTKGIESVTMPGYKASLTWSISDQGLVIQLPNEKVGEYAYVLKITPRGELIIK